MMNSLKKPFYAQLESIAVPGEDENVTKMRTAITEVTDRKMIDQQLQASLKEKEVLLQEVHHRVKNNMQVIISLINLQCEKIEDRQICEELNIAVDRINSMALVHNQLYKSKDFLKVDINQYTKSIAENLFASRGVDTTKISLKIGKNDFALSMQRSLTRSGFDVCELVSTGENAVERVRQEKPDLVIMDVFLNGSVNGLEAAVQIRSRSDIPIVFVTGYEEGQLIEKIKSVTPSTYLIKPITPKALESAITRALQNE